MRWAYNDMDKPQDWDGWGRYHQGKSWHRYHGNSTICGIDRPPVQTRELNELPAPYYRLCKKCKSEFTNMSAKEESK